MKKIGRVITTLLIIAVALVIIFFAIQRINKPAEEIVEVPVPAVEISAPQIGSIELETGLTGTIEAADSVYVVPKGAGEVTEVYVSLGDTVEKGQKLFKIDNDSQIDAAKITLDQLQLSVSDAQTNVNRMASLYAYGDISAQTYEQAVSALNQAKLQYDAAKISYDTQVDNSVVTAPISGVLEQFSVEPHDMVGTSSVGMISGYGDKVVSFSVTERVMDGLLPGDPVRIEKNGTVYAGTVTEIPTMIDVSTGLFKIKAVVDSADALPTGTMVKVFVTAEKADNVMTVPVDCVDYANGDAFVYVYESDGTLLLKNIGTGLIDSDRVEVTSGLEWTDNVVTSWSKEIYNGAKVRLSTGMSETGAENGDGVEETQEENGEDAMAEDDTENEEDKEEDGEEDGEE